MPKDYSTLARPSHTDEGYGTKPFEAQVSSVNPQEESIGVEGFGGPDAARVPHPMLSPNSWIRAMPEQGARVVMTTMAGQTSRRPALAYYSRMANEYVKRYENDIGLYRPLKPGEWELLTPGLAHVFGTVEGRLYLRGGPIQLQLDPRKLRIRSRAPTYKRELHRNLDSELDCEERFGVVVRNKTSEETNRWIQTELEGSTSEKDAKGNTRTKSFAIEYLRKFGRDGIDLIDLRQGDVYDSVGTRLNQNKTGKPLRHMEHVFTKGAVDWAAHEIDEEGSIAVATPGPHIDIDALAAAVVARLTSLAVQASQNVNVTSGTNLEMRADATARFSGQSSTVLGPNPNASNPVILGQQFMVTVMKPLLQTLVQLFAAGAAPSGPAGTGPSLLVDYKPSLAIAASALGPVLSALDGALSLNVKTS